MERRYRQQNRQWNDEPARSRDREHRNSQGYGRQDRNEGYQSRGSRNYNQHFYPEAQEFNEGYNMQRDHDESFQREDYDSGREYYGNRERGAGYGTGYGAANQYGQARRQTSSYEGNRGFENGAGRGYEFSSGPSRRPSFETDRNWDDEDFYMGRDTSNYNASERPYYSTADRTADFGRDSSRSQQRQGMGSQWGSQDNYARYGQQAQYGQQYGQQSGSPQYGSQRWGQGQSEQSSFRGKGPKGYRRSDERMQEDICECLTDHPEIDASEIEVKVKDGEVTLTGCVDNKRYKRLVAEVVEQFSGVRDVTNQIRVQDSQTEDRSQREGQGRNQQQNQSNPSQANVAGQSKANRGSTHMGSATPQ